MVKFEFWLGDNDYDRLYAIKKIQGEDDLSGNEFAEKLVTAELHRLFPSIPEYDDNGRLLNADKYRPMSSISTAALNRLINGKGDN